ncbi:MAG: PSD1 and planctomycete cytochrome C domain-containing protein [Planctomycetota bacterium]
MNVFESLRQSGFALATGWISVATLATLAGMLSCDNTHAAEAPSRELETLFESRVRPLLVAKCQSCHGDTVAEAGLRLDSRRSMLAGSETGAVVVPGDAGQGKLLTAVRRTGNLAGMPPDESLSADEIAALETWVAAGAPWSGPGGDDSETPPTDRDALMEERLATALKTHWAFTPPVRHPTPDLPESFAPAIRTAWAAASIDRFVAAKLGAAGLAPSTEALPRDLFRRLSYDLIGLPPSAAEADAFCAATAGGGAGAEAAYRAAVDRLLASREHAEHWARKWLDLARYADTMGYAFDNQDPRYPFAWTYRDWVIDSLHRDLPYDKFVTLQIAADRIDPPGPPSDLAAVGFLTVGRTFLGNTHDIIDDRIDVVTRGLMGLTVACSRCHDHKYEPVTTADYYALHGIFASCQIPAELPIIGARTPGPESVAFAAKLAELEAAVTAHEAAVHARATREAVAHAADYFCEIARPTPRSADNRPPRLADGYELEQLLLDRLGRLLDKPDPQHPILGAWATVQGKPDDEVGPLLTTFIAAGSESSDPAGINPLLLQELVSAQPTTLRKLAEAYARLVARVAPVFAGGPAPQADEPVAMGAIRTLLGAPGTPLVVLDTEAMRVSTREEQTKLRGRKKQITAHNADAQGGPPRAMVLHDSATPVDSAVFFRGNPAKPGPQVERRLPTLLGGGAVDRASSGRLDLAQAIVAPTNPLTARVIVNWAWTHHMGRGLIDTPGDLGLRGEAPSHPELLDDLARRFMEEGGWSLRWLHREIVTSCVWRQSSTPRPELVDRDPDNLLSGRASRRRLDWEAWRDSLLVAAGTLDPNRHCGPGVDPLSAAAMDTRSVYSRLDRQDVPGILRVFDIANPDTAVHVRSRTTVPQQSLAVLNSPLVTRAARQVTARLQRELADTQDDEVWIKALWRAVLARSPSAEEEAAATAWINDEAARDATNGSSAAFTHWDRFAQALLATAEFQYYD